MGPMIDHVLFIGFGGPNQADELRPFLERVTRGRPISEERFKEVLHHYELMGGFSPYNQHASFLVESVRQKLKETGRTLPIYVGMRNWHPLLEETLGEIKSAGLSQGLAIILAPHRSEASCQRYRQNLEEALNTVHAELIRYQYAPSWYDQPLFLEAQVEAIKKKWLSLPSYERVETEIVFSAHSIPAAMNTSCSHCHYENEYKISCERVAEAFGWKQWTCAYQSRSGNPQEAWLEPDVTQVIQQVAKTGKKAVFIIPIGFWCDHVEVLYDLDVEAQTAATQLGLRFYRAATILKEPAFTKLFLQWMEGDGPK